MKKLSLLSLLALALPATHAFAGFTAGNAVVLLCTNVATGGGGFLAEYNQTNATGYQVTLPATSIVFGNSSTLNHDISLSGDGALVVLGGYANSFASVDGASGANSPRVVATVKYDGTYARPFSSSTVLSAAAFRSAASDGFGNFWVMGGSGGTIYANTPTPVQGTTGRAVAIFNGNLCYTLAAGVSAFSGLPTGVSSSSLIISATAMGGGAGANSASFAIPPNPVVGSVAYLVDYNTSPAVGVGHYHWDGGSWVWDYNLQLPGGTKAQHVAADYSGASPFLWVTPAASSANKLYAISDPGPAAVNATVTAIATAPAGMAFRGVAMAPVQPALPAFDVQPVGTTNNILDTVVFGPVDATRANPNGYSWMKGNTVLANGPTGTGSTISGATTTTLTISGITSSDAGNYVAVASNNGGSATSSTAILALQGSTITTQLQSRTNAAGTTATFHVVSGGAPPLTYAWTQNGIPLSDGPSPSGSGATISGSTNDTLTVAGVQDGDGGNYSVSVTDNNSQTSVSAAALTVVDLPSVTIPPADQNKTVGGTANFSVTATGGSLSYQWRKGSNPLGNGPTGAGSTVAGATTANLTITSLQLSDAGSYSVVITNLAGFTTSDPGVLVVGAAAGIATPPTNSFTRIGSNAVFTVVTSGSAGITYTWKHDGAVISTDNFHYFGAESSSLTVANVDLPDARAYTVAVTNAYGGTSSSATLFVVLAPPQVPTVPNLILYEPFNYPQGPYPAVTTYSWEGIVSTYNQLTGAPAYWLREGGLNSQVQTLDASTVNDRSGGNYPWPGVDWHATQLWYWSSAPNNNHLIFGGVTNGSAYFSMFFHVDQGSALNQGGFDLIAGFTSGDSVNNGANVDTWNYKLCTQVDGAGGDGYYLGVFKGNGTTINSSSANGQWAPQHLLRGQAHFLVGCYKVVSGGTATNDDIVSLWIDPPLASFGAGEGNLPAPDAGGMHTNWSANAPIAEFGTRGTVPPASKRMTELRIGTTWASVTQPYYPELHIVADQSGTTVTWPAKDSGYILDSTPDLNTSWNQTSPPYPTDFTGTTNTVTFSPGDAQYFRLRYPVTAN